MKAVHLTIDLQRECKRICDRHYGANTCNEIIEVTQEGTSFFHSVGVSTINVVYSYAPRLPNCLVNYREAKRILVGEEALILSYPNDAVFAIKSNFSARTCLALTEHLVTVNPGDMFIDGVFEALDPRRFHEACVSTSAADFQKDYGVTIISDGTNRRYPYFEGEEDEEELLANRLHTHKVHKGIKFKPLRDIKSDLRLIDYKMIDGAACAA